MSFEIEKLQTWYAQKKPFVAYKKPGEDFVKVLLQNSEKLFFTNDYSEKGFIFAPFDNREATIIFPVTKTEEYQFKINVSEKLEKSNYQENDLSGKENHIALVNQAIDVLKEKEFKKVVLSRKQEINKESFEFLTAFKQLVLKHKNAFVYTWYHPKVGMWLGATPEVLIRVNKEHFNTMSLAGTQLFKENISWDKKEIEEQEIVTDYIYKKLVPITDVLVKGETKTIKAGALAHLQTVISGKVFSSKKIKEIINVLHPTPAICGFPQQKAKDFILKNENYKRSFYTGFLGELDSNNKTELFVNLRCMEVKRNTIEVYVGGGITSDSIAEKEWDETVNKLQTMKTVL